MTALLGVSASVAAQEIVCDVEINFIDAEGSLYVQYCQQVETETSTAVQFDGPEGTRVTLACEEKELGVVATIEIIAHIELSQAEENRFDVLLANPTFAAEWGNEETVRIFYEGGEILEISFKAEQKK
jgi:hypothetical protein